MRWLAVLLLVPLSSWPALAKSKQKHKAHKSTKHAKHRSSSPSGKTAKGVAKGDLEAKALVRKKAPLVLEERASGTIVRLNKDGTFSRDGQNSAYSSQGRWKIKNGMLLLKWNTGNEQSFRLLFSGKTPILNGRMPSKSNRYVISSN